MNITLNEIEILAQLLTRVAVSQAEAYAANIILDKLRAATHIKRDEDVGQVGQNPEKN